MFGIGLLTKRRPRKKEEKIIKLLENTIAYINRQFAMNLTWLGGTLLIDLY